MHQKSYICFPDDRIYSMKKAFQILKNRIRRSLTSLMFSRYIRKLGPGDIAIDCGANVGEITVKLAKTGASVYAFEPNPYAFGKLQDKTRGLQNVVCLNKGVWDRNTTTRLYFHREAGKNQEFWSFASSIFQTKSNVDPDHFIDTEMIDLAEFISHLNKPVSLLKIDIEGAECEVLEKILLTGIHKKIKLTLVETHDRKIPGLQEKTNRIRSRIKELDINNIKLSWL